ncbi:MAG: hypothetical protein QNJ09_04290 [Paracoccaceae bacterium]|nr:hypothetical protein [Paracoccaceae bacterium]
MSLNNLAKVQESGTPSPSSKMQRFKPADQSVAGIFADIAFTVFGIKQEVWLDRTSTEQFNHVFDIPDAETGKKRKIRVSALVGIEEDDARLGKMIEQLLDGKALDDLVSTHVHSIIAKHMNTATDIEFDVDPVFPARTRCRQRITKKLEEFGLRLDSGVQLSVEPHVGVTNEVFEYKEFMVTPRGGSKRQPIHLTVTLNAPSRTKLSPELLRWFLNETPVKGEGGSIEDAIRAELTTQLDNSYSPQKLRRETQTIREEVEAELHALISTQYGFDLALNIFESFGRTDPYRFNRTASVSADLIGTGRKAEFEVEYTFTTYDEERFEGAFAADSAEAARKVEAGQELTPILAAAQKGNTAEWAHALVTSIVSAELRKALSKMPTSKLPALGILPEDPSLNLDDKVNELIVPYFERVGAHVSVRTASVLDSWLHRLKTGITAKTDMRKYDLAVTTIQPELRFVFDIYLPDNANYQLLNQYLQSNLNSPDPFDELRNTLTERIQNVAARLVISMDADTYLNQTGDSSVLREHVEREFQDLLRLEFGLALRPPLAMQKKPDRVEERYDQMRNETREVTIAIPAVNQLTGKRVTVRLTVFYQVDRLINPNLANDADQTAKEGWERFRSMALKHETLEAHLLEFEKVIGASVKSGLKDVPAEALTRTGIDKLKDKIVSGFDAAGTYFGLKVRVFRNALVVDDEDEIGIGEPPDVIRTRVRIERLENMLAKAEEQYDNVVHGLETEEIRGFIDSDDDAEDDQNREAKLEKQIEKLEASIDREKAKLRGLLEKANATLPKQDDLDQLEDKRPDEDDDE